MAEITLERRRTALLIADFYAEQMSKLEHATKRRCVEKAVGVRESARRAGLLILYSATVFRDGYPEIGGGQKNFLPRKKTGGPAAAGPPHAIDPQPRPRGNR